MPHIDVKTIQGHNNEEKALLAETLSKAIQTVFSTDEKWVTVSITYFSREEWQEVFSKEIATNQNLFIQPQYDPKSLL